MVCIGWGQHHLDSLSPYPFFPMDVLQDKTNTTAAVISIQPIASDLTSMPRFPVKPFEPPTETEPNDTITTAQDTGLSTPENPFFSLTASSGNNPKVSANLDVDFYKVQVSANEQLVVNVDTFIEPSIEPFPPGLPVIMAADGIAPQYRDQPQVETKRIMPPYFNQLDLTLRLFDEKGNELALIYDATAPGENYSLDPYLEYIIDTPGTYYIGISNQGNTTYNPFIEGSGTNYSDVTGNYTISVSRIVPPQIIGTEADDDLEGTAAYDLIDGQAGDDTIQALAGNDRISGGSGADQILAGSGDDQVAGDADNDRIFGEDGNDRLNGDAGDDSLLGGDGFDSLDGGEGSDRLQGGSGEDKLNGGAGDDRLMGGTGYDNLDGGAGDDVLIGVSTTDPYTAYGLYESDTLTGGKGRDTFVLGDRNRVYYDDTDPMYDSTYSAATITDFNASSDWIQLKGSAEFYMLDFYRTGTGTINAALIYDAGIESRGETIAILENVATNLKLTDAAFKFV
jgi:serralysin